jgi:hypothetical protein
LRVFRAAAGRESTSRNSTIKIVESVRFTMHLEGSGRAGPEIKGPPCPWVSAYAPLT